MDIHEYLDKLERGEISGWSFFLGNEAVYCGDTVRFYADDRSVFIRLKDGRIVHEAFDDSEKALDRFENIYEWCMK